MTIRDEIANVLGRYTHAYDMNELDDMVNVFTEDATMSLAIAGQDPIPPFEGRDQIVKLMTDSVASQTDQRRHIVSNIVIHSQTENEVHSESYLTLLATENGQIQLLSAGVYSDVLVRGEDNAWKISKRHLALDRPY